MENKTLTKERLVKDIRSSNNINQIIDDFNQLNFNNCRKSADTNDPDGMCGLGYCYEYGIGVDKDESEAFGSYQKSAGLDNSKGMYQVGYCYYLGIGVKKDKRKAFEHYQKSAKMGGHNGIYKTAVCYRYGIGVKKNYNKYLEWIEKDPHLRGAVFRRRSYKYGKCTHCKKNNTNEAWCQSCDPDITTRWTSRNKEIDDCMKAFQLRTSAYKDVIEWIPFDKLDNIVKIGEGGFGSIYKATWLDGIRKIDIRRGIKKIFRGKYKRSREASSIVALKTLSSPMIKTDENPLDFLSEFKNHMRYISYGSELRVYGITYNPKTDQYFMVLQYAEEGNLHKFLQSNFSKLTWKFKLHQLKNIALDLYRIHNAGYIHADFHSGNILHTKGTSYVSDLGLSKKESENSGYIENNVKDDIYGVMPYVAPEVLSGKQEFTQAADIYGFGVIMAELSTGQRPFDGYKFETELAVKIYYGLRPELASGTPNCYIELANQCMDLDPQERPSASYIYYQINRWLEKLALDDDNDIKTQFLDADETIKTIPLASPNHPDHMYTSKLINTKIISDAINESSLANKHMELV